MNPANLIISRFEEISAIPRGTKYEAGIRQWLIDWGIARNFKSRTDAAGNLVIYIPASAGRESTEPLILQGHLDMVWQKTPDSKHDFMRDPIQVVHDGDWIKANGTTLGADNGIAIALMMAAAEDESVLHPALELLFTVEEELGLVGADNLDPSLLSAKTLINLDTEEEGSFTIGCAGGGSVFITIPTTWEIQSAQEIAFELKVSGLQGGHSGGDINKNRAKANKLIGRVLNFIQRDAPIRLAAIKGGTARNAIPRDAESIFVCAKESAGVCREKFSEIVSAIQTEYAITEKTLSITLTETNDGAINAISNAETEKTLQALMALPNGVSAMSAEIAGFVETSNNIGIMELKDDGMFIISNHRSSSLSWLEEITTWVESIAWLAGAKTERTKIFPPWQPNMDSLLLKSCIQIYESEFGVKPKVELAHGGLECGILSERCGGLDTISLGPTIENPHSPDERLFVPSLQKTWKLLTALLTTNSPYEEYLLKKKE